ncbi:hypothetical protein SD492_000697 [Salmonella enterica]|uniref:hypothetical protein n=1 Tax=Salmonella enterica TaxID=28901 RepID=UPI0019EAB143|nr:hypothetical protein [Salmonella enterica]EDS8858226.1 hypothetical protein [Salmonella enterica subsp. salamae]EDU1332061.1 hypothetical protein [Salmonella enterica subsp. enterica serovar Braenderup]EDX6360992.1 hypothetical protein [Salmonella enterica subsp. enterica serovar Ealing]EAW3045702.1 hypothetical protein [Salmonella enterica]
MRQELEDKIVFLSALWFDSFAADPMERQKSYHGDVVSDMFIASMISNLDTVTAARVIRDMRELADIVSKSTRTGLTDSNINHRIDGVNGLAEVLRSIHEQRCR